jgi:hypothetical protein
MLVNKKPKVDDKKEVEEALPVPSLPGTRPPTKLPPKYPSASAALKSAQSPAAQRLYRPEPTKVPMRTPTKLGEDEKVVEQKVEKFMEAFKAFYGVNYKSVMEADEPKVKIPIEEPGGLELKKGKDVEDTSAEHFKKLIQKDGWDTVSKRIITLKVFNKNKNPSLSSKMDNLQAKLAKWVDDKRKSDPSFGK